VESEETAENQDSGDEKYSLYSSTWGSVLMFTDIPLPPEQMSLPSHPNLLGDLPVGGLWSSW